MNRERLRLMILEGIDRIAGHPFLISLSQDQKDVLAAQRHFWDRDDGTQLDRVLATMNGRRAMTSDPKKAMSPEQIEELLTVAADAAGPLADFLKRLLSIFKLRQAAAPAGCCDDPNVRRCCDEALGHAAQTLASLLHCRACCKG